MASAVASLPGTVVLSASANCTRCGVQALCYGCGADVAARIRARRHARATGHPVDVVVVTRETITAGEA